MPGRIAGLRSTCEDKEIAGIKAMALADSTRYSSLTPRVAGGDLPADGDSGAA